MSSAGRDESSAFVRTKDGQRKFIGGGAMARLNAKRHQRTVTARGNRLLNPLEREQARQTIPGGLPPFERFFAGLLRSEARDFLEANRKGGTETWKTICQRLSLPVPNGPLPPSYNGQRDHFAYRAALVMEEARFSVAEGVRSLEKWLHGSAKRKHPSSSPSTRTSNSNAAILGLFITGIQYKEKTGHSTLTFTKKTDLTRDEIQSLRHGTVLSLCNQERQSTVDNVLLACVLPQSREDIVQLKSFSVMVFKKASISTTGLWDVVPIASLLTEQRMFEACQNFFTGFKSIPFLFPLLGGKGPSHLRFQEDDDGEMYAVQAENGHQAHLEEEKQEGNSSKSLQEIFRVPPLNETQEKAARSFLGAEEDTITLVQGPPGVLERKGIVHLTHCLDQPHTYFFFVPGTGKTTLLLAVICRYVALHFPQKRRLMVCAPTNKAVSVLCERFLGSMKSENPPCNVVLVGDEDKLLLEGSNDRRTATELRSIFLYSFVDTIVDDMKFMRRTLMRSGTRHRGLVRAGRRLVHRLKQNVSDTQVINGTAEVLQNLEDCSSGRSGTTHSSKELIDKVDVLMIAIGEWKRENIWQEVLRRADVIFCTLASAGTNILRKSVTSDMDDLIIDEAAACTEPLMAVAFNFLPRRLLAVGDPKQLPATVASPLAEELGLSKSLHERLMYECEYPHVMLDVQYRMKPEISSFPSLQFYGEKLADAPNVTRPDYSSGVQGITGGSDSRQYTFLDVQGTEAQNHSGSYQNEAEAHAIASVIRNISRSTMSGDLTSAHRLRVITFYAAQVALIKRILYRESLGNIHVATVDSSQGCEADFVIVSFVRGQGANGNSRIGFLSDDVSAGC